MLNTAKCNKIKKQNGKYLFHAIDTLKDGFTTRRHFFFTIQSRLIEKPKIRDVLVLIYGFKLFDEVQCVLLYDLNRPRNLQIPY